MTYLILKKKKKKKVQRTVEYVFTWALSELMAGIP